MRIGLEVGLGLFRISKGLRLGMHLTLREDLDVGADSKHVSFIDKMIKKLIKKKKKD
jgi:hypothetical protein